jgi:hypothetical protein
MSIAFFIQALGMMPLFAARAFLPAFLLSFSLAFPQWMPFLDVPPFSSSAFIANPWVVTVLGILAFLEIAADKNTDLKQVFITVEPYTKTAIYALTMTQLIDAESMQVLKSIHQASFMGEYASLLFLGGGVYAITQLKNQVELFFLDIDPDGDLYINKAVSYLQDVSVILGFLLLLVAGSLALVCFAMAVLIVFLIQKTLKSREEKQKIACSSCQTLNTPFAWRCVSCAAELPTPHGIGFWGQKKSTPAPARSEHTFLLLTHKRCRSCGTKLENLSHCTSCRTPVWENAQHPQTYLNAVRKRLPMTLLIAFGLGFVPILGMVVAMMYANLHLNAPLKRHLPKSKNLLMAFFIRFVTLLLLFFGSVFGFLLAPLYVLFRFGIWQTAFSRQHLKK